MSRTLRIVIPIAVGIAVLTLWEIVVRTYDVPLFVLPAPCAIWIAFVGNFAPLMAATLDDAVDHAWPPSCWR